MARLENALLAVAGAPTAVTNGAIAGILDELGNSGAMSEVYGAIAGLTGLLDGRLVDLGAQKRKTIEGLRRTPGSVLSGRHRYMTESDAPALVEAFKAHEIGTLFVLGGLPALELAKFSAEAAKAAGYELTVMCVPLSPENEVSVGDHCPGYGSAVRAAALSVRDAGRGAQGGEEPVVVLEIGGAGNGWLAGATALARDAQNPSPHLILLPERDADTDELVEEARRAFQKYGYVVVVTTDGAKDKTGESLSGQNLSETLSDRLNLPARFDRIGLTSSVSGANIARGDADEAYNLGVLAAKLAEEAYSSYVVAYNRDPEGKGERGYKVVEATLQLEQVEELPRSVPGDFILPSGTNVSEAFLDWARPLVGGALPEDAALS